ncbi:uncharacterized protein KY384_007581 [Bacidia gigantensis]|uniref:uncharacterized protein n=1 Tax=Bacidia gigantensis TaxID=2732470 RepID=UPI001D05231C|nr:uncharacterized protein KY384_007581 [Bacidia gigantensis]KAG8527429.1 hypothetical protein KY384_007581 [Bacidia gigantensis]
MSSTTTSTATPPKQHFDSLLEDVRVSKADFNHIVMDYLVRNGYPSSAEKFAAEANIQPQLDLDSIAQRVKIREAIHSGDIQTAIEEINEADPQLLDKNASLHFALLRLQLIELIRHATAKPDGDITPALDFATTYLAPRASIKTEFLGDLELAMALLIFPPENLTPVLAELLQPSLRQKVATDVNEALLRGGGEREKATIYSLISHRAWAEQRASKERSDSMPEGLALGLEPANAARDAQRENGSGTKNERDREGDSMATGWDVKHGRAAKEDHIARFRSSCFETGLIMLDVTFLVPDRSVEAKLSRVSDNCVGEITPAHITAQFHQRADI